MRLKTGYSRQTFDANFRALLESTPRNEAYALAFAKARESFFKTHPGGALPSWLANPKGYRLREHYDSRGRPLKLFPVDEMRENPRASPIDAKRAKRLAEAFTGRPATGPGRLIRLPAQPRAGVVFGQLIQVGYQSERDGALYRHTFRKSSRPLLIASSDGKQVLIVGGRFAFTERGIVDK